MNPVRTSILISLFVGNTACLVPLGPGQTGDGSEPLDEFVEDDSSQLNKLHRKACRKADDIDVMWHPNTALAVNPVHVTIQPNADEVWNFVFSGTVWAPLASLSDQRTVFYTNEPDAIQATYRADIISTSGSIRVGPITEVEQPEPVPVAECPDLFRMTIPLDREVFYLELDADFVQGDVVVAMLMPLL